MIALIDKTMMSMEGAIQMTADEMFEAFGDFDPAQYEAEVQQRWGGSDAHRESTRRAKHYKKADWERFKAEQDGVMARMLELFDAGIPAADSRAMDLAESARLQIDQWFYPCSKQMHLNLGEMYVSDPRFTAYYDKHREGLAVWFRDAIRANAERE